MKKRVLFFGTPEIAVPSLEALAKEHTVVGVITKPDKPVGRKQILTPSPIAQTALALGLDVLKPKTLKPEKTTGAECIEDLRTRHADVCVVFAYGKILPKEILELTPLGCVNVHPSLLPELRGPSPIQTAIARGFSTTGISIMLLDEEMDTGPILLQQTISVDERETGESLHNRVASLAPALLLKAIDGYTAGKLRPKPQDSAKATYCAMIRKSDGAINWSRSAKEIDQQIRAFTPWPGAFTIHNGLRIKILEAHLEDGVLIIDRVHPEGKNPMSYNDFIRGYGTLMMNT